MINESIAKLVKYGENAGLVSGLDKIYATNRILEIMQISDYEEPEQIPETPDLEETLNELLDDAAKRGVPPAHLLRSIQYTLHLCRTHK